MAWERDLKAAERRELRDIMKRAQELGRKLKREIIVVVKREKQRRGTASRETSLGARPRRRDRG